MVLELRPAHDPRKAYGFVGVVTSTADLSASVWLWERADDGTVSVEKVISIPAEPAEADQLPPLLQPFGAVPPLVTDISLSVDDQDLYVSCWGTGELKRFDVSDPQAPRETGVRAARRDRLERARTRRRGPLNGGPQMVETSRDGKRIFLTNSLYAAWDAQFYPDGIDGWFVKLDADEDGSLTVDPDVFVPCSAASARTRSGCAAATRRRTRTASRQVRETDLWPLHPAGPARRLSRAQPRDGLAVRGRAGDAGALPARRPALAGADRDRPRALDRARRRSLVVGARPARRHAGAAPRRRHRADRVRRLPLRHARARTSAGRSCA